MVFLSLLATLWIAASSASAAGSTSITVQRTNSEPVNSGAAQTYRINLSCSSVAGTGDCGKKPTIRIPLTLTSSLPNTPPMDGGEWKFAQSSGLQGLVKGGKIENGEYVIELDEGVLVPGDSDTIEFSIVPPNGTTPNGTSWEVKPSFVTEESPPATVPTPATGKAQAKAELSVSKATIDGGAFYVKGHEVIYNITAQCFLKTSTGKLYMTEGSLLDQLPAGLQYLSATPAPTSVNGSELLWEYPDAKSMPKGCGQGSEGPTTYQVRALIEETVKDKTVLTNNVTFSGKPIDEEAKTTVGKADVTVVEEPPADPGTFLSKAAQAPLCIEGTSSGCYTGTYPGNWIKPIDPTPSRKAGSSEGRFDINIRYATSRAYETAVIDPMPCLENQTGQEYSSPAVVGEVKSTAVPACNAPAFHPTVVWVSAPSLEAALGEGWHPNAILTDGTVVALAAGTNAEGGTYFEVPAADVGNVKAIELPPTKELTDNKISMSVFGYGDASLEGGQILHDVAFASAYPIGGTTALKTSNDDAKIYIEPNEIQLGIGKSFGGLSLGTGGVKQLSTMTLSTSVSVPPAVELPNDVIITDLLPKGMTWSKPVTSAAFTITQGLNESENVTGTIELLANYNNTGQELIRVTLPKEAFEKFKGGDKPGGFFTIKATQSNLFVVEVENETSTFNNSAQIFLPGADLRGACGNGLGTGTAEFESKDELDLSGSGNVNEQFCQATTELKVTVAGTPNLSLRKFVHGDAEDPATPMKGPLGIGEAKRHGFGTFKLVWSNSGTSPVKEPVIYDILPYVGDTGVDENQVGNARESEFDTEFAGLTKVPAGITVEYSESSDPCRPEVYPNQPAGCANDWSPTAPGDPTKVKALRFSSSATYKPQSAPLEFELELRIPNSEVNNVAWNSAATTAMETSTNPHLLLPAEPEKVGITTRADKVTPTIVTNATPASILPGAAPVSDEIKVEGTDNLKGTVKWKLVGPVSANGSTCPAPGSAWNGAPTVKSGEFQLDTEATTTTRTTDTSTLTTLGCYGYEVEVTGSGFEATTSPAGSANEVVLVHPAAPTVTTQVSEASILPEREVSDTITIGETKGFPGTVHWKLLGPVSPESGGTCPVPGAAWTGAATKDEGTIAIVGDEAKVTTPTKLADEGCYGYEVTVEGPNLAKATSPAGTTDEVVLVHPATPSIGTKVSAASILPEREAKDAITVSGTEGFAGKAKWKLLGPVSASGKSCPAAGDAAWTGARTAAEGEVDVTADGVVETASTKLADEGCYGYEVTLEGEHLTTVTSPAGTTDEVVLVHPAGPTVSTRVSAASVQAESEVTDAITVAGTEGFPALAKWKLAGPVTPAAGETCDGLDWSGAATVAEGEVAVAGDGTVTTAPTKLTAHGCYGYAVTIEGGHLTTAVSPLGSAGETVLVHPMKPTVATTASPTSGDVGAEASDKIDVGGTGGLAGTVHWKLAGPVSPGTGETCDGLNWAGAGVVAEGEFAIKGDASQETPKKALTASGCYGYEVTVEGPHLVTVTSPLGSAGETVLIKAAKPTGTPDLKIVKRVEESKVQIGKSLHYTIEVTNKGTAAATNTVVTDKPESPLAFVSARSSQGTCGKSFPLTCKLGTLAPGAKATVKVTAKPLAGGKVLNSAEASAANQKGAKGVKAAAASHAAIPLRLSKTVAPGTVKAGGRLHYTITVSNPTGATAHGLKVCDRLPAGLAYVSSSPAAKLSKGSYCWKIAALKGHASKKIRVLARALAGAGGKLVNVATLEGPDTVTRKATAPARVEAQPVREGGVTG